MIDPAPLYADCANCGGSGIFAPPRVDRGGGSWSQEMPGACPDCAGVGAIPSAEGRAVLELVQRFSRNDRIEFPR